MAAKRAATIADTYRGRIAQLGSDELIVLMRELAAVREAVLRASTFAELRFATDTADTSRGALMQHVEEASTEVDARILFFELEWSALSDQRAEELLDSAGPALEFAARHLRSARLLRPHRLSEPEERILIETGTAGSQAWMRLFNELCSAMVVELDGERVPFDVAYNQLSDPDREKRRQAAEAMSESMEDGLRTRTYIFNTLLHDHSVQDRLRSRPHWLRERNLENQTSDDAVMALIESVRARFDLPQRLNRVKARLIGIPRLAEYDRAAPVLADGSSFRYSEARELVLAAYEDFSPAAGAVIRRFFDEPWIDAPIRPHKMSGAFCEDTVPDAHPYLLLNFSGRRQDVLTMAHELGHGLHAYLARDQGVFHQSTPMTVAETASTFGEQIVLARMLGSAASDQERLSLLCESVQGSILTIFTQIAFNRFEHLAHTRRRSEGELSTERLDEFWREVNRELNGDTVESVEGFERFWSVVPHFFLYPGYVYAYAYGQLLSLSVYARYLEVGEELVPSYLAMLSAGSSRRPEELAQMVGVSLADPGFWDAGLALVDEQLQTVEALTDKLFPETA